MCRARSPRWEGGRAILRVPALLWHLRWRFGGAGGAVLDFLVVWRGCPGFFCVTGGSELLKPLGILLCSLLGFSVPLVRVLVL